MKLERELASWDEIGKPVFERKELYFPSKNASIYLKSINWGLTGDHKITVVSPIRESNFDTDSISEYIFHGFGGLIYKTEKDTLKIYSMQEPFLPTNFESEIKVQLIKIEDNGEWIKLKKEITDNYRIFE